MLSDRSKYLLNMGMSAQCSVTKLYISKRRFGYLLVKYSKYPRGK